MIQYQKDRDWVEAKGEKSIPDNDKERKQQRRPLQFHASFVSRKEVGTQQYEFDESDEESGVR